MKLEEYFKIADNGRHFMTIREKIEDFAKELSINILDIKENLDMTAELWFIYRFNNKYKTKN